MSAPVKIELDSREFMQAMNEWQRLRKLDDDEAVVDRAGKLSFEFFKRFKEVTISIADLRALPSRLGYHIKRKFAGTTIKQEINRRIRARFAAASGWLPAVRRFSKSEVRLEKIKNPKGRFEINLQEPSVTIINEMKEGVAAEERHKIMQGAIDAQTADMRKYIERKLDQECRRFSAR